MELLFRRVSAATQSFPQANSLPGSPVAGQSVTLAGIGPLLWDGSRWVGADGVSYLYTAGTGLQLREPVIVLGDVAIRCNATVHSRVTGVCAGLSGSLALIRLSGIVGGYTDLTDGAKYCVGLTDGSLTAGALGSDTNILPAGVAVSDTELFVRTGPESEG